MVGHVLLKNVGVTGNGYWKLFSFSLPIDFRRALIGCHLTECLKGRRKKRGKNEGSWWTMGPTGWVMGSAGSVCGSGEP